MNQELTEKIRTYVWNIMDLGPVYDPVKFNEAIEANKNADAIKKLFSNFTDEEYSLNMNHLLQGYGAFGKDFISNVMTKDPKSATVMFETVTQAYLDLRASVDQTQKELEEKLKQKLADELNNKNSN